MIWLFPSYIAAVVVVSVLRRRYRRRHPAEPPKAVLGKILLGLGKAAVGLAVFYFGVATFFVSAAVYDYYMFFTPSRIATVEERTGIIIGDDVKPIKYIFHFGGPNGPIQRFTLRTDLDSDDFMEKCCVGEVVQYTENGVVYNSDGDSFGTAEEYYNSDCTAYYRYKYQGREYSVAFRKDGTILILS